MSQLVNIGSQCMCTMGTAPSGIRATTQQMVSGGGQTFVTVADASPANIGPFGMCTSLANPAVASATAAALGVLTPQPCTPTPAGTWMPVNPAVTVGGSPCLTMDCKLQCSFAGTISIVSPGQFTVTAS